MGLLALGRNLVKYRLLRSLSLRSDRFGREHMADLAARFVKTNDVRGDYLEFGVFRGSTFAQFYHAFRRHGLRVPMYAFDSFEGLPAPAGVDAENGYDQFGRGQFRCSQPEFVAALASRWVPRSAYTVVPGFYEQSLTPDQRRRLGLGRAAVVWIDCVLYASARAVLDFVAPCLQIGTLLLFNDYYRFRGDPRFGEQRALRELLEREPDLGLTDYAKFGSVGQAFIVHRTAPDVSGT